jgi:hypothetical protein
MSLQRNVRKSIEGGSTSYATVEEINNGLVTVKLLGSNSRITNLEYIGSTVPIVGSKVVIDYSAGDKPIVRISEDQLYSGERYMNEAFTQIEMQSRLEDPNDEGGVVQGGVDVGLAVTTKPGSIEFPNEPHAKNVSWIQYWGKNTGNWESVIYDSGDFDDSPTMGTQFFDIPVSGIYLISLITNADIPTLGVLKAEVMRGYGTDPDVCFLKGIAANSGYGNYFNMDVSKIVYLPADDQISVQLTYTGSGSAYSLKNTSNPLKWVTAQNEFIFKIQLLSETIVEEPDPPYFVPGTYYWWGASKTFTIAAIGSGHSVELPISGLPTPWYMEDIDSDGANDLVYPIIDGHQQIMRGMVCTMHYCNYYGDCGLHTGTNTTWMRPFNDYWGGGANEFSPGQQVFIGDSGAAAWTGMTNDPGGNWEGIYSRYPPITGQAYLPSLRIYFQLGWAGPLTSFTLTPVWHGWLDEEQ